MRRSPGIPAAAWVEVSPAAAAANARAIRRHLRRRDLIAVVKEDAYGHGGPVVARALSGIASTFGVATVAQAAALRRARILEPVLLLSPAAREEAREVRRLGLIQTVADRRDLAAASFGGGRVLAHVKFDTGMGRLGVPYERAGEFSRQLRAAGVRRVDGVYTHLAAASDRAFTERQLARFDRCVAALREAGVSWRQAHAANSEAVVTSPRACAVGAVRPGLMLYGCSPTATRAPFPLTPVLSFHTRVLALRTVAANSTISYGHTYVTKRRALLAVLPVGYSSGLGRGQSNRGEVLIRGRRAPIRGRVCMNYTVVDVSAIPSCRPGDRAVLIGRQGRHRITAEEVAEREDTLAYEILCTVGGLNRRRLKGRSG